jgi:hypothetical protein
VWFNAHHLQDSNQVATSIMHAIGDVKARQGKLSSVLRIQADNYGRENKNIYMFGYCTVLVAQGYFKEVQLSFLIVGHTHEDIDQRFSIISNTLKRQDVDSLRQLLQPTNEGAWFTESFFSARLLENVWNWKSFITPYLITGGDSFVGISLPHHMRFSMANGIARVQYKHYCPDQWRLAEGYECLAPMRARPGKPSLAPLKEADLRELKALANFIAYKEHALQRLQYVECNI